jgi:hypothetical protein
MQAITQNRLNMIIMLIVLPVVLYLAWTITRTQSKAATTAIEAEVGTIANPAAVINDANASGGKAIQFGSAALPSPTIVPTSGPTPTPGGPLAVFPGAQGFGITTKAGRGGQILRVTNLNDSGAGSLRAALEATGPRTVVFEVSGTIPLSNHIYIRSPFITVAGQTAPSPGITLRNAGIQVETNDVLIQHLRIRVGDTTSIPVPDDRDAIAVLGPNAKNVVIDHNSFSWAVDENASTWYAGVNNVTFSNNIISEGLNNSLKGTPHSKGLLLGDFSKNVSVIGNLMAHNAERQPLVKGDVSALIVNNVAYDVGFHVDTEILDQTESGSKPSVVSSVGNVYIKGPSNTRTDYKGMLAYGTVSGVKVYQTDNIAIGGTVFVNQMPYNPIVTTPPVWTTPLTPLPGSQTESSVYSHAGARPKDRDTVDTRIVTEAKNRTGKIIDSQTQVGGWPTLAQNKRAFTAPTNPNSDDDGDGYTNLEEVLQQMATALQ